MKTIVLTICDCQVKIMYKNEDDFHVHWRPLNNKQQTQDERFATQAKITSYLIAEGFLPNFEEVG